MAGRQTESATVHTDQTLRCLHRLPPFNQTAVKILSLQFGANDSLAELEACFRLDPLLTSQLLVAANSAAFGLRSRISTIRHALTLLGLDRIRSLVATVATTSYMRHFPIDAVRPIWSHGIATAVIAEHLATYSDCASGAALYTAGLTHDIGRLGLLANSKEKYETFLLDEYQDQAESELLEWETFGVIHTVVGGLLAQMWGFPACLCSHAENHHQQSGLDSEADRLVHTACLLAGELGYPEVRLRSTAKPDLELSWQTADDREFCRGTVEQRIEAFLL